MKPKPKPKPATNPNHSYVIMSVSVTPRQRDWLRNGGNASYKVRAALDVAMKKRKP